MRWKKLGLVYQIDRDVPAAPKRAMVPTPYQLNDDVIRVFFTLCDYENVGHPHYIDVDAKDPTKTVGRSNGALLEPGKPLTFDEHGVVPAQILRDGDRLLMYYSGFERGTKIPYRIFTGLAVSTDGGESFERMRATPILERSEDELMFRCAPFVRRGRSGYCMWYVAGSTWETIERKLVPQYVLKYVESEDGVTWPRAGVLNMELGANEHGFGRPWIEVDLGGDFHLYYSIRQRTPALYRLGYATSKDGLKWERRDEELGLLPTPGSFDSAGMSYTSIIKAHGETYCFYNGNDFGAAGFGVARLLHAP